MTDGITSDTSTRIGRMKYNPYNPQERKDHNKPPDVGRNIKRLHHLCDVCADLCVTN
jgi:hypothetical protein